MLIREALDKQQVAVPVSLNGAFPIPSDAIARTYRGVKFGEFIDIHPYAVVQRLAIEAAKKFVADMRLQGYELLGNETDLQLWGPYRDRTYEIDKGVGFALTDEPFPEGKAKMLIAGRFLARRQHVVES